MFTAGGGVEVLAGSRMAARADTRYRRVSEQDANLRFPEPDLDVVRIGGSFRYRF